MQLDQCNSNVSTLKVHTFINYEHLAMQMYMMPNLPCRCTMHTIYSTGNITPPHCYLLAFIKESPLLFHADHYYCSHYVDTGFYGNDTSINRSSEQNLIGDHEGVTVGM